MKKMIYMLGTIFYSGVYALEAGNGGAAHALPQTQVQPKHLLVEFGLQSTQEPYTFQVLKQCHTKDFGNFIFSLPIEADVAHEETLYVLKTFMRSYGGKTMYELLRSFYEFFIFSQQEYMNLKNQNAYTQQYNTFLNRCKVIPIEEQFRTISSESSTFFQITLSEKTQEGNNHFLTTFCGDLKSSISLEEFKKYKNTFSSIVDDESVKKKGFWLEVRSRDTKSGIRLSECTHRFMGKGSQINQDNKSIALEHLQFFFKDKKALEFTKAFQEDENTTKVSEEDQRPRRKSLISRAILGAVHFLFSNR